MKFSYSSGQRPLEGYTLKRGVGRGGFGEVYFGVSDGGKEVALKLVRGDHQVELRGVAQCLNLKHPNLVYLYDLLTGRVPFEGESSGEILMKHLTSPPDLSRLPSAYVPIVAKALAKNPAHRYGSMAEMARAVEAVGLEGGRATAAAAAPAREV